MAHQYSRSTSFTKALVKEHPNAIAAIVCGLLVFLGWLALQLKWMGLGLLLLPAAYVIGGYESAREGLTTLWQEKELDVDLLMIVAALGAAGLGLWRQEYYLIVDGAVLILIFAISGALHGVAFQSTERDIRSLMSLSADTARVVLLGQEQTIPVTKLQLDDCVLVKPGELIPIDGIITEGYSSLNEAPLTGESLPVEKTIGDEVFAGTLNGNGALMLQVHKPPQSSLIQRIQQLVQQAQSEAPPSQQFIEKFERHYARIIIVTGLLLVILPPWLWGWDWETTIYRALIFLVVASPCALVAATMPALLSGIANGARQGILFKSGTQLETIGRVKAIAFDKTGTLTTGQLQVVDTLPAPGQSKNRVLQVAAAIEIFSEHPIGQAIVRTAQQQRLESLDATTVQAQPGQGAIGEVDGRQVVVGKAALLQQQLLGVPSELCQWGDRQEESGQTVVWVAYAGQVLGAIALADTVRPEAREIVANLKKLGIEKIVMVTGDNWRTARKIGRETGVDQIYAELLPEDKVKVIQHLQQQYKIVAMVGDGINDAPALAQASVGIAMGAAGSNVALETADVVLMTDRLKKLEQAIRLGRRSQVIVKQNIAFALCTIILLLLANFAGKIAMPLGVIGHEGSTVIVTLSGLRLLRG
ncbi:MAG: Zinc-transporting ATPase [Chroococcidiopsis sp. SAG 2025]|uniref:heavy metal translocating P-type ATPase n=1 Tax=Chroococcidiopsis sp. SAG 2025 TaxID=171389 RepID=UPI002937275D|nr:heavy metal translocating P-type ATPase [Chroococcidiopsis sp. SAG 2025]MDV2994781.1 Zinc-transporting ATPase [Chroococcidiopsis sp. SAG 2025]